MHKDLKQTVQKDLQQVLESIPAELITKEGFGNQVIHLITSSFELSDIAGIKAWLEDHIDFLEIEISYTKKYSKIVYHPNVSRSREAELTVSRYILRQISTLH